MKLSQFKIKIPEDLVAIYPTDSRDESRMMVVHRDSGKVEHKMFKDIVNYFEDGDSMVFNDTKVFPARLCGTKEKTGARIEVFLLRELNRKTRLWDVMVDPARKIRIGNKLYFGEEENLVAEVIDNTTSRGRTLRFLFDGPYEDFKKLVYEIGETPLPKYIKRPVELEDEMRYQTIFAKNEGAVAAPTAGMHFSKNLMKRLELQGTGMDFITLHTGLGSFRPVEVEDLTKHKMDSEQLVIPQSTVDMVNKSHAQKKKVCAVGTTVLKSLESSVSTDGNLKPFEGWNNNFIYPPANFEITDALVTNLHHSASTLLMTVAAFGGYDLIMDVYKTAVKEKYRFHAYGDAMLIL